MSHSMPHYCSACGEVHGTQTATDPSIEVARINAERDVQIAKLQARQSREANEHFENVATIEGEAQVASTEALAEGLTAEPEPESEPEVVVVPEPEPEPEVIEEEGEPAPPESTPAPVSRETKKRGWWDAYSR